MLDFNVKGEVMNTITEESKTVSTAERTDVATAAKAPDKVVETNTAVENTETPTEEHTSEVNQEKQSESSAPSEDKVINLSEKADDSNQPKIISQTKVIKEKGYKTPNPDYNRLLPRNYSVLVNTAGLDDESICKLAADKLTEDTYWSINGLPLIACYLHIYNKALEDVEFAKRVCEKSKNFYYAFEYLSNQVKKLAKKQGGNGVGLSHILIFEILEDYFNTPEEVFEERRRKEEAERKAKQEAIKAKAAESKKKKSTKTKKKKKDEKVAKPKESEKPKKKVEEPSDEALQLLLGGF